MALSGAIEEADSLHRLLDTALEISRAEAGIGRDQFTRFALPHLLEDLAEMYGPLAEDQGFRIELETPLTLDIVAHRDLLMRALSNLIDNALKYAVGGSVIAIAARIADDRRVQITISDDGPGLTLAQMATVTQRFVRLDPARGGSGAGLGLSLVETIAHLHDGTLRLEANAPRGLCVCLAMPVLG